MVQAGTTSGSTGAKGFFYIGASSSLGQSGHNRPNDAMADLIRFGFVQAVEDTHDHYQVLPKGLSGVLLMQTASFAGSVSDYKRIGSLSKPLVEMKDHEAMSSLVLMTRWELQMILMHNGWRDIYSRPRKVNPLSKDSDLEYYYGISLGKEYLMCLILLERFFSHGLVELHHFQLQSYYDVLIDSLQHHPDVLARIVPNQPMAFYKEIKTRNQPEGKKKGKKRTLQTNGSTGLPEGFEHEDSLSVPVGPSAAASLRPTARRARGRGRGRARQPGAETGNVEAETAERPIVQSSSNLQSAPAPVAGVKRVKTQEEIHIDDSDPDIDTTHNSSTRTCNVSSNVETLNVPKQLHKDSSQPEQD